MKRIMMLLLFTVIISTQAIAQDTVPKSETKPAADASKATTTLTADQIIDAYEKAVGGRAAYEKLTSRVIKGTVEIPAMGVNATFEQFNKAPNMFALLLDVPGYGNIAEVYDGKTAWAKDPASGLREKSGGELATTKLDSEFYKGIKLRQLYPKLELKGKEKIGEREAYIILASPSEGSIEKWFFDVQNGLLVRTDAEREGPQGKMPFEGYLEDYRVVDGVKLPFTIRMVNPAVTMIIKYDVVKHNDPVDDAKFVKP